MGDREIEIQIIENTTHSQVAFSSRRAGLFKKARELSISCDAEVALTITGKLHEWASSSMKQILDRYQKCQQELGLMDYERQQLLCEMRRITKENESFEASSSGGINSLRFAERFPLEQQLEDEATEARRRKYTVLKKEKTKKATEQAAPFVEEEQHFTATG